jgi:hypothetical protein
MNKDLISGLTTKGNGLLCGEVYLSCHDEKISRSSFAYGEKIFLIFEDISGFEKTDDYVFPGLRMTVLSEAGDTILQYPDLYAENIGGFNLSPLVLTTNIIMAEPIHSKGKYKMVVNIWDKQGTGTYSASMDFDVKTNDQITVESSNITFRELYLYSKAQEKVLTKGEAKIDEEIYLIFEGLDGFQQENGTIYIGLSITAKDASGRLIVDEPDLIGDSGVDYSQVSAQLAPSFVFTGSAIKDPVTCEVKIWDKKGENSINARINLNIQ